MIDFLVTGAAGFVGSWLIPALRTAFPESSVVTAGRVGNGGGGNDVDLDIATAAAVDRTIAELRPRVIINLAAQSSVGNSSDAAQRTWDVNFVGAFNLACAFAKHVPNGLFFQASSSEVYGAAFNRGIVVEAMTPEPLSPYGRSKAAAETMLADVLSASNRLLIVRAGNHSGRGQRPDFVIPSFAAQMVAIEVGKQEPRLSVGNLDVDRDFTDVRDVVGAYLQLLQHAAGLPRHITVNVASGRSVSIRSIVDLLVGKSSVPIEIFADPARQRPSDVPTAKIDTSLLHGLIDWQPRYTVNDIVESVLAGARAAL